MRLVSQTNNPKRRGEVWITPHASTYSDPIALWVDDKNYIAINSLVNISFYHLKQLKAWGECNKALLEADEYVRTKYQNAVTNREAYEDRKAAGEVKVVVKKSEWVSGQGIVRSTETITVH